MSLYLHLIKTYEQELTGCKERLMDHLVKTFPYWKNKKKVKPVEKKMSKNQILEIIEEQLRENMVDFTKSVLLPNGATLRFGTEIPKPYRQGVS